ncbi:MAG TPA: MFS transporter [Pseudolysinimonas sp.]|nr:MFS transporter [Pseudolysinimonas sp.]
MTASIAERIRLGDPVLRILATSTFFSTLGRGVFLTLTTLYLGFIIKLDPEQIAMVFGAASVSSIVFSLIGGHLSDRISARRMTALAMLVNGITLAGYVLVHEVWLALVIACVQGATGALGHSSESAILGRAFSGALGVRARAVLRTLTNIGIGIGAGVASIPLVIGTADSYRFSFVIAAVVVTVAQLSLFRLPVGVDAPIARGVEPDAAIGQVDEQVPIDEQLSVAETALESAREKRSRRRTVLRAHSPWHDARYLVLCVLGAAFTVQFTIQEVGMPLWVAQATLAPHAIISVLLVLNTIVVVALTVPLSRNTHRFRTAGRVTLLGGVLLAIACAAYAVASGVPVFWACVALVAASVIAAVAEVLTLAGIWGLSFELADPVTVGSYQGVFGTSYGLGSAVGPALIAATAIAWGWPGWGLLGLLFVVAGGGVAVLAFRAARLRPEVA